MPIAFAHLSSCLPTGDVGSVTDAPAGMSETDRRVPAAPLADLGGRTR
ncbi:hypothetical protein [Catenuloplanes indicus]|uniref:Uncharacterized protein n=1 Tax=Catenuloplanes indicus TaxID=137267 RepID=A0AAE4AUK5_9ACTN|nr:hypothetical protein [Catenuloplanes indicus]MDQ0363855.1 hypothetical protein [Catenuloplanes indicus]